MPLPVRDLFVNINYCNATTELPSPTVESWQIGFWDCSLSLKEIWNKRWTIFKRPIPLALVAACR